MPPFFNQKCGNAAILLKSGVMPHLPKWRCRNLPYKSGGAATSLTGREDHIYRQNQGGREDHIYRQNQGGREGK